MTSRTPFNDTMYAEEGMLAAVAEPIMEPCVQPYLEIVSADGDRLVTAIEILSKSNKSAGDPGRLAYQQKQQEFRLGGVHMVEIDLLRAGQHVTAIPKDELQSLAGSYDYHVCVTVVGEPTHFYVKPIQLMNRLPTIVIPLDPGVSPISVDLQPLLDRAYDTGRYSKRAKYAQPCNPPLNTQQQTWAETILRDKGLLKTQ